MLFCVTRKGLTYSSIVSARPLRRLGQIALTTFIALMLTACGFESADTAPASGERLPTPIAAYEVQTLDLSRQLRTSGLVEAREHARVHSRISGNLLELSVDVGDNVNTGQSLAQLDLAEQRAELTRARALLEEAQLSYERANTLRQRGTLSPAEYQQIRANRRVTESEVEIWQARIGFGTIRSPIAGVVTARYVEPGEFVQEQDLLFTVADMNSLIVRFGVSELDIAWLSEGQEVPLQIDALPRDNIEGTVRRIFPAANEDSRRVPVEVALPADAFALGIRPGFLARMSLAVERRDNVLAVPVAAVLTPEDGPAYVYVVTNDQYLERRDITTGASRQSVLEITEGLVPGEVILATSPRDRRDGERVRIAERRQP